MTTLNMLIILDCVVFGSMFLFTFVRPPQSRARAFFLRCLSLGNLLMQAGLEVVRLAGDTSPLYQVGMIFTFVVMFSMIIALMIAQDHQSSPQ